MSESKTPVADHLDLEDGQVLPKIKGKLINVFNHTEKEGQYGTYTMQNGKLQVEGGGVLSVTFFDVVIPQSAKGHQVILRSQKNQKNVLAGVVYEQYNGKNGLVEQLKVRADAEIEYLDGEPKSQEKPQGGHPSSGKSQYSAPSQYTSAQYIFAMTEIAAEVNASVRARVEAEEEALRALVATCMIELGKNGILATTLSELNAHKALPKSKQLDNEEEEDDIPMSHPGDKKRRPVEEEEDSEDEEEEEDEEEDEAPAKSKRKKTSLFEKPVDWSDVKWIIRGPHYHKPLPKVPKDAVSEACLSFSSDEKQWGTNFRKAVAQYAYDMGIIDWDFDTSEAIAKF